MTPGQAPVRMDGKTFSELVYELRLLFGSLEFLFFAGRHIEPIEDES